MRVEEERKMMMMIKHNLVMQKQNSKRQLRQVRTSQPSPMLVYPRHHHLFLVIRGFELVSWGVSEADTSSRVLLLNFLFGWSFFQQDRPRSRPGGRSDLRFEAKY